nr:MAG TPA: hypothetical protein [Crassvirales sp.]
MLSLFSYSLLTCFNLINILRELVYKIIYLLIELLLTLRLILLLEAYSKYLTRMNVLPDTSNTKSTILLIFLSYFNIDLMLAILSLKEGTATTDFFVPKAILFF